MPIYEYKCENGHVFDVIQKFTDEALSECQECGAPAARVLHPVAIHFKGSGFHNTDYKTKATNGASSDSAADSKESSKSKGKDSKANEVASTAPREAGTPE
jgi:putative FmdB family regulatory protein